MIPGRFLIFALISITIVACRSNGIEINVTFDRLNGLQKEDSVLFQGNVAGHVKSVRFRQDGRYDVLIEIDHGFANAATEYSKFYLVDDPVRKGYKSIDIELAQSGGRLLASGTSVHGVSQKKDWTTLLQEEMDAGLEFIKEQISRFERNVQSFPESPEYEALKKTLEDLAAEIEKKEKAAREKIKREWLPKIQRELDDLRKKLEQNGREEEMAPLEREMERIQRI